MARQNKAQKRKAKLEKRRKAEISSMQQQTELLVRALTKLCAPSLPEYIDDSRGVDLVGRTILFRLGMIGWNLAVAGRRDFDECLKDYASLDEESQNMIRKEVELLRLRKLELFPEIKSEICDVSVVLKGGVACLKLKPKPMAAQSSLPPALRLADELMAELEKLGTAEEAEALQRYHKVPHRYLGVRVPAITQAANEFATLHTESEILAVGRVLWQLNCHEAFLAAGKLFAHRKVTDGDGVWRCLQEWKESFDSWAMADVLMPAAHKTLKACPKYLDILEKEWLTHPSFWVRRACLTFTMYSAKTGDGSARILSWAARMTDDPEWFIQKAIAWYLRELSKHDPQTVGDFLQANSAQMKSFAIREASKYLSMVPNSGASCRNVK